MRRWILFVIGLSCLVDVAGKIIATWLWGGAGTDEVNPGAGLTSGVKAKRPPRLMLRQQSLLSRNLFQYMLFKESLMKVDVFLAFSQILNF